jgi:hypothetical protein
MKNLWVTLCLPVSVDETTIHPNVSTAEEALDVAWERLLAQDGPPEGLLECVSPHQPVLPVNLLDAPAGEAADVLGEATQAA